MLYKSERLLPIKESRNEIAPVKLANDKRKLLKTEIKREILPAFQG
jgi:hypothetical protein